MNYNELQSHNAVQYGYIWFIYVLIFCYVGMENDLNLHWFTVISLEQSLSVSSSISELPGGICLCELLYELIVLSQPWCWNVSGMRESRTSLSCGCLLWWGAERLQRILIRLCHFSLSFFHCDSDSAECNRQCCCDYTSSLRVTEVL